MADLLAMIICMILGALITVLAILLVIYITEWVANKREKRRGRIGH